MDHTHIAAFASMLALNLLPAQETAPSNAPDELAKAVAEMRNLPTNLSEEEAELRGKRVDAAWETLVAAKDAGAAAVLAEAARIDAAKQKDDVFKLGAAVVVWQIGHLDRAKDVVALWRGTDLTKNYNYVFFTAFEAVRDGDARALPMLAALLRDQKGRIYVAQHAMEVRWPETHRFLWGPMGRKALPALAKVLDTEQDPIAVASAITLLASHYDAAALPRIRRIARDPKHSARIAALAALGKFGHPEDYELLSSALTGLGGEDCVAVLRALCEYGDLRAVPRLLPLAKSTDAEVRRNAMGALGLLATVDGLEAFAAALAAEDAASRRGFAGGPPILRLAEVEWDAYLAMDRAARAKVLADARAKLANRLAPEEGDRKLTRDEFQRACKGWIAAKRITGGDFEWVESRHVLAIATPADVPLLLDVRGSLFRRLSDECLYEVRTLDELLGRLVRSQYRLEPGMCEHVKPVAATKGKGK